MFNNTSKILPYSSGQTIGVILPHSDKILSAQNIDQKIKRATRHIDHLTAQLSHRNTHGGTRFRGRQISLKDQISVTSEWLSMLKTAKTMQLELEAAAALEDLLLLRQPQNPNPFF